MSNPQVFFFEAFEEERAALERLIASAFSVNFTGKTVAEAGADAPPARVISIRTQSRVPEAWLPQLDAVLTRSTGYDHLTRVRDARGGGPACGYLPSYCARSVAEQAVLLWMALLRRLPEQRRHFAAFDRDGLTGSECACKKLAVVGVGRVGFHVVRMGEALGMEVVGADLVERHDGVRYASAAEAVAGADVVVCAMNLTEDNRGYFDEALLRTARKGAVFVNVARGEMAPPAILLRLVKEGHLGGVGLDVFDEETDLARALRGGTPPASASARATLALAAEPNVIVTPHNAFNTREALEEKSRQTVVQLRAFLETGRFVDPIPD